MELKEVVETRASIRQFTDEPIEPGHIREIARLAGRAPSINNSQPWRFIAITNRELLRQMAGAVHKKLDDILPICSEESEHKAKSQVDWFSTFFEDAPAVVAVATHPYTAIVDDALNHSTMTHDDINALRGYPDVQSVGACIQTMILAAVDLGYGTCWLSGPLVAKDDLEPMLGIHEPWKLSAMVAIGKPAATVRQRDKKPVDEILEIRE